MRRNSLIVTRIPRSGRLRPMRTPKEREHVVFSGGVIGYESLGDGCVNSLEDDVTGRSVPYGKAIEQYGLIKHGRDQGSVEDENIFEGDTGSIFDA